MALLSGVAAAWPLAAWAQGAGQPVIGYLSSGAADRSQYIHRAFREGLHTVGYSEGTNVTIEYRWAEDQYDRLPALAAELARDHVNLIVATGGPLPALAAKSATATIPIVFQSGSDPVAQGLVDSLSRPSGNLTGVTTMAAELGPKRLELLHEAVPGSRVVALLLNPANPSSLGLEQQVQHAAQMLGVQLYVMNAVTVRDLDMALTNLSDLRVGALVIAPDPFFTGHSSQLGELLQRLGMPTIYQGREFAEAGGLMSFGGSFTESYRQLGIYAGRILKGEKPADLPIVQVTRIELVINLKTAKTLGLVMPPALLARADEIIE